MLFNWTDPLGEEIPQNQEKQNIIAAALDVSSNIKTPVSIILTSGGRFKPTKVRKFGIKTPSHSVTHFSMSKRRGHDVICHMCCYIIAWQAKVRLAVGIYLILWI